MELEFWKHVTLKQNHICVHSGSIDSGNWGYGFAVSKNSPFARHSWNLKVLTNNSGSVLRAMGPVMGVTVPTLHVGMVFSSCCWYRDPHSLPWIEYLHTGGNKIWYGVPNSTGTAFHAALKSLVPNYCRNKSLWLPSDTVMVPPNLLIDNGVSLCRIVQEPGQFIVVFPKVFTSSLSTGTYDRVFNADAGPICYSDRLGRATNTTLKLSRRRKFEHILERRLKFDNVECSTQMLVPSDIVVLQVTSCPRACTSRLLIG